MMIMYEILRRPPGGVENKLNIVAEVIVFSDGVSVIHWIGEYNLKNVTSTTVYNSLEDLFQVHLHSDTYVRRPANTSIEQDFPEHVTTSDYKFSSNFL